MVNSYIFNGVKASAILFNRRGKSKETLIVDTQRTPIFGLLNGVKDRKETRPFLLCLGFPKQKLNRLIRGLTDCIIVKINTQEEVILIVKSLKKIISSRQHWDIGFSKIEQTDTRAPFIRMSGRVSEY